MESGLYKKYISKSDPFDKEFENLQKINKTKEVKLKTVTNKRVNWSDNPIREADKVKHPKFAQAMKAINTYTKMKGGPKADDYFRKNIEGPAIRYNNKTYSLQALIPD